MAGDEMFKKQPYDDKLFATYNKIMYGNRKNKFDENYKKTREAMIYKAIQEYGRDSKTNASKAYGFIGVPANQIAARIAIIRVLSISKEPLTKAQIIKAVGYANFDDSDDAIDLSSKPKYLLSDKTFILSVDTLIESGIVVKYETAGEYPRYGLSTDIFEGLPAANVYSFLDFIDHSLPFTGIIHSLYAAYDVCPTNVVCDEKGKPISKKQVHKVDKVDHSSINQIMVEYVLWSMMSAYSEKTAVTIKYFAEDGEINQSIDKTVFVPYDILPLRAVYDNLYNRLYIFGYVINSGENQSDVNDKRSAKTEGKIVRFNAERIVEVKPLYVNEEKILSALDILTPLEYENIIKGVSENLDTAWTVYDKKNGETEKLVAKFKNTTMVKNRLYNERRHGEIKETEEYLIYTVELNNVLEIKPWLRTFGRNLVDVAPEYLKQDLLDGRNQTIDFYNMKLM